VVAELHVRPTGMAAPGQARWGEHLCHLYRTREDLLEAIVPYFAAGLAHGERCLWIAGEPVPAHEARDALRAVVPDLDERERRGQIEIVDDEARSLDGWLAREQAALREGYAGLRIHSSAPPPELEARAHGAFHGRRIIALCSYALASCGSEQLVDVMRNHHLAVVRHGGAWRALHSATAVLAYAEGDAAPHRHGHTVEFFAQFPGAAIGQELAAALAAGKPAAAIARPAHLDAIRDELRARRVDIAEEIRRERLRLIDGDMIAEVASRNGTLDFGVVEQRVLAPLLRSLAHHDRIRVYGEVVDVLARRGQRAAALELEAWWNVQVAAHPIELHCGYSLAAFADAGSVEPFRAVCDVHDAVCAMGASEEVRLHAELDQLQRALTSEARRRHELEPAREHLVTLQRVMSRLAEVVTTAEVVGVVVTECRQCLHAIEVGVVVEEDAHWRDLVTGSPLDAPPRASELVLLLPLRVHGQQIGILSLALPPRHARDADHRALAHDIAQQVASALDRARVHDAAEQANRAKDELLAMLGHELRNPLSPIVTALQLMRLRGDPSLMSERVVIERQVGNLVRLIDDLLDVSRIARGKVAIERRPVELADVITAAIEQASPALTQESHHLHLDIQPGITLEADASRLAQVIANLVTNAAKFTPAGGRIEVLASATPARAMIAVRDNGIGIAPELLPSVFDQFVQGYQGSDRARGGLGLGLAIAKGIVELHGGAIRAESPGPGRGSTFTIELPRLPHVRLRGDAGSISTRHGALRILVVDDNEDARELLGEALRQLGHEVHVARDGHAGLELALRIQPDVAVLDLGLPGMDGYQVARAIRGSLGDRTPRLIAVTGYGQATDRQRSAEAGFAAHLVKPVVLDVLQETILRLGN
jgi:signal transduction histidine kinase/CheY-like chemotaxis protein